MNKYVELTAFITAMRNAITAIEARMHAELECHIRMAESVEDDEVDPDWSEAPWEHCWHAIDGDGARHFFKTKPNYNAVQKYWYVDNDTDCHYAGQAFCDPQDTLVERPVAD